ncbi:hypothetical protein K461DRAFT_74668 [Myriangium duriaei CBS 260.36]|uniref:Uncharacterized protein n=1 Tax=Myriangium duriaei CBS 260.36 TaxID=1168546 RepID=A0A9P4J6C2_9PEZI|nr:hypothetical protein K461DRAFT_74668 [Myriangium duriaei CBS 260.36]
MGEPYLSAALRAPQSELDLSGNTAFRLEIVLQVRASEPIVLYTKDTYLSLYKIFEKTGIEFSLDETGSEPVPRRETIRNSPPNRTWHDPEYFLTLSPGTSHVIQVPFGWNGRQPHTNPNWDTRHWANTRGFVTGKTYKAKLPSSATISWWCRSSLFQKAQSDSRKVPTLPTEAQLPVHVEDGYAKFTCVGHRKTESEFYEATAVDLSES